LLGGFWGTEVNAFLSPFCFSLPQSDGNVVGPWRNTQINVLRSTCFLEPFSNVSVTSLSLFWGRFDSLAKLRGFCFFSCAFEALCRSRVTYCRPKQSYKLASQLMYKSTFPGYFTCGLVYNLWSFGGNRVNRTERTACHPS
jgi:hypothetical protein